MRNNGVLISTDGPFDNVLKIKPPMAFGRREADIMVEGAGGGTGRDVLRRFDAQGGFGLRERHAIPSQSGAFPAHRQCGSTLCLEHCARLAGGRNYGALVTAPPDYQQGETVRIMYVHVPAAWMALFIYTVMALASAVAIIFRHPLAERRGQGCGTDRCCLLFPRTGHRLARQPYRGTWWEWDARLTSMFVLFLLYIGYMAIWQAIDEPHRAAMIARIVALVGFVNVPIVKFSVDWWNSLHQPASVFRTDGPTIAPSMLWRASQLVGLGQGFARLVQGPFTHRAAPRIRPMHYGPPRTPL